MNACGAWATIFVGSLLVTFSVPLAAFLPETRSAAVVKHAKAAGGTADSEIEFVKPGPWSNLQAVVSPVWRQLSLINRTLFVGNPVVGLLLFSTLFFTLGKSVSMMMLQYVTKRFGWSWAKVSPQRFTSCYSVG